MLKDKLHKIMAKKRDISGPEKDAKMGVVKHMQDMMSKDMGDKLSKVSVMSDSKEGLKKGLDKAQDVLGQMDEGKELEAAENPYHDSDMAQENNDPELAHRKAEAYADGGEVESEDEDESDDSLPEGETGEQGPMDMSEGSPEHEEAEMHDLASVEQKLQELMALKAKLQAMHK